MFSSKMRQFLATVLVIAMTVSSAGFNSLAMSINNVTSVRSETDSERQKTLSYRYYQQYKAESLKLLMNDEENTSESPTLQKETKAVEGANDNIKKDDASVGAEQSSTDKKEETITHDSESFSANKDENKDESKDENIVESETDSKHKGDTYGPKISTSSDAEDDENNEETTNAAEVEEPEVDETTKVNEEDNTATTSDAENEGNENNEEAENDTATTSETEKNDGGDVDDETTATNSDVNEENNEFDLGEITMQLGDGNLLGANGDGADQYIDSYLWDKIKNCGATEIYFLNESEWNSAPGTVQPLDSSRLWWREDSNAVRTETSLQAISHPGSVDHGGTVMWEFDSTGHALKVKVDGTKYYFGPKQKVNFHVSHWGTYFGKWDANAFKSSFAINSGNVTSVSYTGNAVYGLYAPSSASMKDFPNVKKMVLKELKLQDASGVGLFKDLTNLEELVLGSSIINNTNDFTNLFSGCTKLKSVTFPNSIGNNVTNLNFMFKDCAALQSVTFNNISLFGANVNATSMFEGCSTLKNINFGSVDLTKIANATAMFKNCTSLETIWVNAISCRIKESAASSDMFQNCKSIKGYKGTTYDSSNINANYAHVDMDAWKGYFTTDDSVINDATVDMKIIMQKTSGRQVERNIKALKAYTYSDFTSKYLNPIVAESGYEKILDYDKGFGKFICSDPNYSGDDIIVRFVNVINNSKIDISDKTLGYNGYLTFLVYVNSSDITWILGSDVHWADGYVASESYIRGKKFILPTDKDIIKEGYYLEGWLINDKDGNHDEVITEFLLDEGDVELTPVFRKGPKSLWFGTYPQNDATGAQQEPIKWRKINENGSEALYVADSVLDNVSFHSSDEGATWADSNMHTWLNDTFKEKAFTNNQIDDAIINKTINTSGSADTTDKVFVLSYDEANNYFADNSERIAEATNYAKNVDNGGDKITVSDGKVDWWLRTFGTSNGSINVVSSNGELDESGINPTYTKNGVRPALYLDLDSTLFRSYNNTITWNLGDELSWADSSTLWGEMTTYQGGQELPAQNNLATDRFLYGWKINDGQGIYKEIPENQTGNITLTPIFDTAPSTIWYGTYPQNDSTGKQIEPIKWRKLIENGGTEAVYVAENILDNVSYNKDNENTTWADSSIYSWLNDTSSAGFAGKAFTSNQLDNSLSIVKDKELVTSGSANINGKVNLLSLDDAQKLFKNDANRKASATAYAKAINNKGSVLTVNGGYSNWWLRSPGSEQMSNAAVIGFDGIINSNGSVVNASEIGVRPVLYVDITSETFKYDGNKVTWNLGSATWAAGSTLWGQMTNYQCGQALPKYNNLNIDKFLIGWKINNSTEVYKEIPNNQTGDITLTPVYGDAPDTLWLGLYPQNDVKGELLEPIKWRKLSQNGRSALYISDKVIDHVLYNDVNADVEWDTCTLHSWLNDSSATGFLGKTLTSIQFDDKTSILKPTELVTGQSIHTTDKVFLLKSDDVNNTNLFATKDDLKGKATEYTKAVKRNGKLIETSTSGYVRWWLRASYIYKNYSLYVTTNGTDVSGPAYYENTGLRPAINIDFESPLFRCTDNNLTWDLGDGMTWADRSTLWGEMTTYQGGQKLPTDDNLSVKYGYKLDGWFINGDRTATYSEIPSNQTGDITLTANWVAQNDENFATYKIKWELGAGANWVDGYKPITSYVSGWKTSLPTNADVVKNHYVLEGWYINDDVIADTIIPSDQTGNITLKAKWTCDDYYVIPYKWYRNDLTGHEPMEVTAVHILRYPDIVPGPHGISASYEIEGSNGLMVYYTNTNEVYICAPQDKPIYTPEDSRYLFGTGRGSSTVNSRFSSVTTITGLDLLDTSKTKDMASMFNYMAKLKSIDISSFDTFNVTSMKKMFYRDYELESINFGTIHTKNVTDMESMFEDNNKLKTLDLKGFNTQKLTSMDYMFRNCNELTTIYATKNFVTTAITSTKTVFSGCTKLKGSNGTTYSTDHTDASYAWIDGLDEKPGYFYSDVNGEDCYILPSGWFSFNLAGRNPSQVKRIEIIKSQTPQINADILKKWDIPGSGGLTAYYTIDNVVYIYATNDYPIYTAKDSTSLFYPGGGAADSPSEGTFKNLEVIKGLDLLDTSRTTNMTYMFMDLQKITSLDLSSFDTSNVTSMQKMFGQCYALESIDLSNFDTRNVTTMSAMFEGDKKLKVLDLRSFKTPNLTTMYSMFTSCEELTTIYVTKDFVTTALESTNNIFYGCSKLVGSNDTHYSEYHTDASYAWIDGLDGKPGYFSITVYTLPKTWITGTTENSSGVTTDEMKAITTLTISRYPEVAPANYDKTWDIVDSDGLKGYLKGDEAIVYAEESSMIYLPEDCGEFFTPATYDTSKNVFDKVKVINNLSLLKTKKVTNMSHMFANMNELESVDLSNFDTSNVTDMEYMFSGMKEVKTLNLGKFDTTNVTNMTSMFEGCDKLEDILVDSAKFATASVVESNDMFKDCLKLTGMIGSRYSRFGNQDVTFARIDTGWDTTTPGYLGDVNEPRVEAFWRNNKDLVTHASGAEWVGDNRASSLGFAPGWYEELGFTLPKTDITSIKMLVESEVKAFDRSSLTEQKFVHVYLGDNEVATYSFMLKGTELYVTNGLNQNDDIYSLGNVKCHAFYFPTYLDDVSGLFEGFTSLESLMDDSVGFYGAADFTGPFILPNVKTAKNVFKDCHKLKMTNFGINVHADKLVDIEGMFENCYDLPSDVVDNFFKYMNTNPKWTTKLQNMKNLFKNCHALTKLNLNKFDTSDTTNMTSMFEGCSNLSTIMVSDTFVTTHVTASENMFNGCTVLSGAEGTSYAEFGNRNAAFAIIDKGEAGRGYLSELLYVLKKGWYSVDKSQVQPFYVNKIRFASFSEVISSYETTWSVDDGLKAYTVSLGTTPARYEVVIKGDEDRKIYAPTDSSYLFSYLLDADGNKLEAYGFNNVTAIENIEYLDTRKVATASHMFDNMGNITSLDLSKNVWLSLRDTSYMFNDNVLLETLKLSNFDTKNVSNMEYMFNSCRKLTAIDVTNFDTANVENMKNMFYNVRAIKELDISNFNTEEVMDMSGMFYGIGRDYAGTDEHIKLNLSNFNTSNVTNMASMFSEANIATLSLVSFDTSKVISMSGMFAMDRDLQSLTLGDSFDTSNVTNMSYMFYLCSKLDVLDVSKFNTSKVTNMASMFTSVKVETLDVSGFDTSNVTNISGMFSEVAAVGKLDLSNFNTSKVTDMSDLFRNCYIADDFELDLKSFDTSKVTNMNFMFAFSHRLTRIKVGSKFVTTNVNSSDYMFGELDNLRGSLGTTLASTSYIIDKTYARIDGGVAAPGYFSGDAYIVTFDAMDGYFPSKSVGENKETIATASVYVGTLIDSVKPENPVSNRGYEFVGWRVRGGVIQDGAYAFDYDATFEAVYESDEKTKVRLNTGVGTFANGDNERITYMAEGDDTGRFERPVAEGYTFDEYYVNDEVLKATWSYASNDEVEVVAKYIPNNYRIIFNGNGATSGAMAMEIATYGETHILSKNQFENDGYDFGGWFFIDEDGQHNFIDEGEAYNLTSVKDGEIKLTAVWEPKRTVIHYESNGATITLSDSEWNALFGTEDSSENTPETMTEGDGLFGREYDTNMSPTHMFYNSQETLSPNRYYRPGYEFEGWALSPDTAAIYFNQSEIGRDENYQEDINLYAKWKPKKEIAAKLILDGNGGTINGAQRSEINLSYGEYLPQVTIENPGYELDYWENTYKIFGIITIRIRCEFPEFCDFFGERTLTAHWKPIKYTLRLNENFGENNYYDVEATYGEEPDISFYSTYTALKNTNARFTGWSTEQDAEEGIYINTASAYPSGVQKGSILNLYANWSNKRYTVRLHGIDPSRPLDDDDNVLYQVFDYGKGQQLKGIKYTVATINDVTAEFVGWSYDPYLQNPDGQLYSDACIADRIYEDVLAKGVNFPLDFVNVKQIELWPEWTNTLNSSYIIFDGNGGTIEGSKIKTFTYTAGKMIQAPDVKDIYRKGYELDLTNPWVDKDGNVFTETTAKPDGEIHLYANWKQKTYDIEYVGIGDETILVSNPNANSIKKTMQGGEEFVVPDGDMFERPGYDFLGWDTKVAASTVVYKPGQTVDALGDANETVKLYTVWQPRVYTIYYYDGEENLIGTNSFIFTKKVRVLPNEGITEGTQDAGFTYEVNGEIKKFSSGQSLNAEDFEIVAVEKEKILNDVAERNNNNLLGNIGRFFNNLFGDGEETIRPETTSPLLGDPGSGGGIVLKGNTAKQIYNLTFDANGGQFPDGETVKTATASTGDDMSAKWPPEPTNTTDFVGWAIELDDGTNIEYTDTTYTLTESITFKAKWDTGYYARLLANGGVYSDGSTEQLIPMRRNEATNKFEIPTRTGYDFDNYYVRTVAGEEALTANWNYFANETTNVVAHWKPYNYKIVYDANGGTGYMPYEIATVNVAHSLATNRFAKDGYRFNGWYVEALNATQDENTDVTNLTMVKDDVTYVRATWAPLTYDIVYNANEGTGYMAPDTGIIYGTSHKLKANTFTKVGHNFRGWSLATGSDITYFDEATISDTTHYNATLNLYAEWIPSNDIYGTLKLHGNDGLINGASYVELPLRYHEALVEPILSRTGYKFTNWTDNAGNVVAYPNICNFTELELTANWTPIKYNVRYYANGGTFSNGVKDFVDVVDIEYETKFNLKSAADISRQYYTLNGWKQNTASGINILGVGTEQSKMSQVDSDTVDLYASWAADTYNIVLHQVDPAGSAMAADTVMTFTYGEDNNYLSFIANKIATVNEIGYEFAGWAVPTERNKVKYFASQDADIIYEVEGVTNIDLWPVWVKRADIVYVTFDGNGGKINGLARWVVPFATGSELVYPISENVYRKGYVHNGWLDSDKTTPYSNTTVDFTDDKTIYADWAPGNYTIEYVAVGGNGVDDIIEGSMSADNKSTAILTTLTSNAYERIGYTFEGWDTNPDAKVAIYSDGETDLEPLGENGDTIKLYTVWKANEYTVTYKDYEDNIVGTDTLVYGSTITLPANDNVPIGHKDTGFELVGHTGVKFVSGATVTGQNLKIDKHTNLTTGIVLKGTVEKIVYIVTFDANGGTYPDGRNIATASITYGDRVSLVMPPDPVNGLRAFSGYIVDGAYRDVNTLTYDYTSNKTFIADWNGTTYKIEYNSNAPISPDLTKQNVVLGPTMATQSALANRDTQINPNSLSIVGYNFIGWATASYTAKVAEQMRDSNDPRIIGNRGILNLNKTNDEVVTLYAMWGRNRYRLTIEQNEDTAKSSVKDPYATASYIYYDELLSDNAAFAPKTRTNYTFQNKWTRVRITEPYARSKYNGTDYLTTSSVYRVTSDLTLYPLWTNDERVITLVIDSNEAKLPDGYTSNTFIGYMDAPLNVIGTTSEPKLVNGNIVTPIATPYDMKMFDYWSTVKGDDTTKVNQNELYDGTFTTIYANVRYRQEYMLSYNANGGTGYMASSVMREGIKKDTQLNAFTKDGYLFGGWTDQYGEYHGNGAPIDNPTRALTLYANWNTQSRANGPSSGGPGGGSGGGGGGGGRMPAGSIKSDLDDGFSMQTPILLTDYTFIKDEFGLPSAVLLKRSSSLAKALLSSNDYNSRYKVVEGDNENIILKNGFYNIQRPDGTFFYLCDRDGKIKTGFTNVDQILLYVVDAVNNTLSKLGEAPGGKYYLMEEQTANRGILYSGPIVLNGIKYLFDSSGRVISETAEGSTTLVNAANSDGWRYDPVNNAWSYYTVDSEGNVTTYRNGAYPILAADNNTYYYVFDDKGFMKTGLTEYNGNTYYLREDGLLKGSVYTGEITLNNKTYMFDAAGVMVSADKDIVALTKTEPGESGENRFIP